MLTINSVITDLKVSGVIYIPSYVISKSSLKLAISKHDVGSNILAPQQNLLLQKWTSSRK